MKNINVSFVTQWELISYLQYISACETGSVCILVEEKAGFLPIFIEKGKGFFSLFKSCWSQSDFVSLRTVLLF